MDEAQKKIEKFARNTHPQKMENVQHLGRVVISAANMHGFARWIERLVATRGGQTTAMEVEAMIITFSSGERRLSFTDPTDPKPPIAAKKEGTDVDPQITQIDTEEESMEKES